MTDVMQKRCETHKHSSALKDGIVKLKPIAHQGAVLFPQHVKHPCGDMKDAQGVLESGVRRARINMFRERKLPDSPKPLKDGMVHDVPFPVVEFHESVNGNAN